MSETVVMPRTEDVVRDFVAQVRAQLADLPGEDVEELTSGMEADLAERVGELPDGSDVRSALGSPQAYAAELRSAAGLPDAVPAPAPPRPNLLRRGEQWLRARHTALVSRYAWLPDLRTTAWLARGAVLGAVAGAFLVHRVWAGVVLGAIGAVLSLRWSRSGAPAIGTADNRLRLIANVAALALAIPVLAYVIQPRVVYVDSGQPAAEVGPGVWVNGEPATNLYAYDAAGNRLDNVRLFNQYGQALAITNNELYSGNPTDLPIDANGNPIVQLGVFPVRWAERSGWEVTSGGWDPPVKITELLRVPPLATASTAATPQPTATTPATNPSNSSATATSTPTASATPTVTTTSVGR